MASSHVFSANAMCFAARTARCRGHCRRLKQGKSGVETYGFHRAYSGFLMLRQSILHSALLRCTVHCSTWPGIIRRGGVNMNKNVAGVDIPDGVLARAAFEH